MSFREAVEKRDPQVGKALAEANGWLSELDTRRNTLLHRTVLLPIHYMEEDCQKLPASPEVEFFCGGPEGIPVSDYLDSVLGRIRQLADDVTQQVA